MRRHLVTMAVFPLVPFAASCADGGSASPALEATVDTVGGVERLSYPERRAATLDWSYDTLAVLGGFDESTPALQFGSVTRNGLAEDSKGNLYVLDGDGVRVLGFSPKGEPLGEWGREGGGPGEFGGGFGPGTMAMGPGDTLWVGDLSNQRLTLIPTRGGSPGSVRLGDQPVGIGGRIEVTSRGALAELTSFSFTPDDDAGFPPRPLVWIGRDGTPGDTAWIAPAPERDLVTLNQGGGRRMMLMMTRRFSPDFLWTGFSDGTLAVQDAADYRITFLRPDGSVIRRVERAPAARFVTEADRRRILDQLLAPPEEDSPFSSAESRRQMAEAATFSEVIPRVVSMVRDGRDRLWVGVSEAEPGEVERIDVFDRDGRLLGELRHEMPAFLFGDGFAVFLGKDELEVQNLTIVRIIEPSG